MNAPNLLQTVEHETGPAPQWTVLWLHGLGADGNDFAPIVPELVRPGWPSLRFVFPHAPVRPVTINNGVPMRAWYDIVALDLANRADETGVNQSVEQVEALREQGHGHLRGDPARTRLDPARDGVQQGGLARAVRADERDAVRAGEL